MRTKSVQLDFTSSSQTARRFKACRLLGIVMCLAMASAAASWGGSNYIVNVGAPKGTDDTAAIQQALNTCVQHHPTGCTVQLAAGTYYTRQLVTYNFNGTFKGMGVDKTTIEALPNLPVKVDRLLQGNNCAPNVNTCLWPSLIIFVDGNIHVSDMSLTENAPPGTATTGMELGGSIVTDLFDVVRFMGRYPTNVWLDRIHIEGLPDDSPTSYGFNIVQCASYAGELPYDSAGDAYFLTGRYTVRNSSFKSALAAVEVDGFLKDIVVIVGGAPTTGNVIANVGYPIDTDSAENSSIESSYNTIEGLYASEDVMPWGSWVPSKPSLYSIHDNHFTTAAPYAEGIFLYENPGENWIQALVYDNTIALGSQGYPFGDGIGVYNTTATVILNNSITGSGGDAIELGGSALGSVIRNSVKDFTLDPTYGLAQIYLDPATSKDLVVCAEPSDTVLNQGSNNFIVGCPQPTAPPEAPGMRAAPDTSVTKPALPRKKPDLYLNRR